MQICCLYRPHTILSSGDTRRSCSIHMYVMIMQVLQVKPLLKLSGILTLLLQPLHPCGLIFTPKLMQRTAQALKFGLHMPHFNYYVVAISIPTL